MVVTLGGGELADAGADGFGLGEIQRCPFHVGEGAGGDEVGVGQRVAVGGDPDDVPEDVAAAGEVEVGVVGEVDGGGLVGGGFVLEAQLVVVGERVDDGDGHVAGVTFLAVGAADVESDAVTPGVGGDYDALPDALREAFPAAVDVVLPEIRGHLVVCPVDGEAGVGDAVGDAADDGGGGAVAGQVRVERVGAHHDVGEFPVAVWDAQLGDGGAAAHDLDGHAVGVAEGVEFDGLAFGGLAEHALLDAHEFGGGRIFGRSGGGGGDEKRRGEEGQAEWCVHRFIPCSLVSVSWGASRVAHAVYPLAASHSVAATCPFLAACLQSSAARVRLASTPLPYSYNWARL